MDTQSNIIRILSYRRTMLNKSLLQKVKQWILDHPSSLNMSTTIERKWDCGTVGCIAGITCILSVQDPEQVYHSETPWTTWTESLTPEQKELTDKHRMGWGKVKMLAMQLLGITNESAADKLFFIEDWEGNYADIYMNADGLTLKEAASAVAEYIDYYIQQVEKGAIAI